jgi:hypothetical protein
MEATKTAEQRTSLPRPKSALHRLSCAAQNYAWGKDAAESEVRTVGGNWATRGCQALCGTTGSGAHAGPLVARPALQVAQLVAATGRPVDESKPYAELW